VKDWLKSAARSCKICVYICGCMHKSIYHTCYINTLPVENEEMETTQKHSWYQRQYMLYLAYESDKNILRSLDIKVEGE
jgi:hypothetical protein